MSCTLYSKDVSSYQEWRVSLIEPEILLILALTMFGEAGIMSNDAALGVGHVLHNRAIEAGGYEQAARGFYGYDPHAQAPAHYYDLARQVLERAEDPTQGSVYVFSHQDLHSLFGDDAPCIRQLAPWQSELQQIKGIPYRLYSYQDWPGEQDLHPAGLCDERWEH